MSKTYQTLFAFQHDYHYDLSDEESFLGEGTYGQVIKAYDDTNHRFVALKIGKYLMSEFEAAKNLEHRNIAKYEACYRIPDKNTGVKDYAIMQLYPEGNLSQLLKNKTLSIEQKKGILRGILEGLKYLHSQGRIHRDLKPANILIVKKQDQYIPLISDFGLTKVVKESDYVDGSDVELSDSRGTASYKAPEQIEGDKAHFNLDLWAFGVILYEMMLGERPFNTPKTGNDSQKFNELLRQIKEVSIPEKLNTIQQPYQAMIRKCLVKDIHVRVRKADELIKIIEFNETEIHGTQTDKVVRKSVTKPSNKSIIEKLTDSSKNNPLEEVKIKFNKTALFLWFLVPFLFCVFSLSSLSDSILGQDSTIDIVQIIMVAFCSLSSGFLSYFFLKKIFSNSYGININNWGIVSNIKYKQVRFSWLDITEIGLNKNQTQGVFIYIKNERQKKADRHVIDSIFLDCKFNDLKDIIESRALIYNKSIVINKTTY